MNRQMTLAFGLLFLTAACATPASKQGQHVYALRPLPKPVALVPLDEAIAGGATADHKDRPIGMSSALAARAPSPHASRLVSQAEGVLQGAHLASYRTEDQARVGWVRFSALEPALIGSLSPRVARVDLGEKGVYERLTVGPFPNKAAARSLCAKLRANDRYCEPMVYRGRPLAH